MGNAPFSLGETSFTRKKLAVVYLESWDSPCSIILRRMLIVALFLFLRHIDYSKCISFVGRMLGIDYIFSFMSD